MQFFIHSLLHPSLVAVNGNEKKRARTSTAERAQLYPRVSYSFYMRDTNKYNWRERGREILYVWDRLFLLCTFFIIIIICTLWAHIHFVYFCYIVCGIVYWGICEFSKLGEAKLFVFIFCCRWILRRFISCLLRDVVSKLIKFRIKGIYLYWRICPVNNLI